MTGQYRAYLTNFMKKRKEHGNVGILARGGHNVEIAVLDEGERALLRLDQRVHVVVVVQIRHQSCNTGPVWCGS